MNPARINQLPKAWRPGRDSDYLSQPRLRHVPQHIGQQSCRDDDGKLYRCGQKAAFALSEFIGAKTVSCAPQTTDRYRRTVAVCSVAGVDMADWLVRSGLAFDWPQYSKGRYTAA
jgi:endonuclease YncB( thermonuclease family)